MATLKPFSGADDSSAAVVVPAAIGRCGRPEPHPLALSDRVGLMASGVCMVHCVAMTVALTVSPLIWFQRELFGVPLSWLLWLEYALASIGATAAISAAWLGFRLHRQWLPAAGLLLGASLLLAAVFSAVHSARYWGTATIVLAGCVLIASHWLNYRLRARC